MFKTVPISELVTDRSLVPGDDVKALAKHINDSGLQVPILIREDMFIVDGVRRVEAMRLLGFTVIDAMIPIAWMEAADHLARTLANTTEAYPLKPRRMYQIKRDLVKLVWSERGRASRGHTRVKGPRPPTSITGEKGHVHLAKVFGVTKTFLAVTGRLYHLELTPPEPVSPQEYQRLLDELNDGLITPGAITSMLDRSKLFNGSVTNAASQRESLRSATAAINGVLGGLAALGPLNKAISRDELLDLTATLQRIRKINNQLINVVTEEMHKR